MFSVDTISDYRPFDAYYDIRLCYLYHFWNILLQLFLSEAFVTNYDDFSNVNGQM